ncbi:MAG: hypothetical protein Pg6C_17160 [Treponemataceae bacterium]|nr:MAG: hypothetical protein Pg6C_17160 [Treponemataceae bacterium]
MVINGGLGELKVPGFPGYTPPFGTKKADGQPVSSREHNENILLPFKRHRPVEVIEDSSADGIEDNLSLDVKVAGITLVLGNAAFTGCRVKIYNTSGGAVSAVYGGAARTLNGGESLELEWIGGAWVDGVLNALYPLGSAVLQYPWDKTPAERGFPGTWENWSSRAVIYGLSDSPPPPCTEYSALAGTQITQAQANAGFYALLVTGGTRRIYKIKASFANLSFPYTVPPEFDCVKWESVEPGTRAAREAAQGLDFDSDLDVGDAVSSGAYAGKYVAEVLSAAGCFFGVEGGFRPTFISGGIQSDAIREISGEFGTYNTNSSATHSNIYTPSIRGAFHSILAYSNHDASGSIVSGIATQVLGFKSSLAAPAASQNQPQNMSVKLWLRIS